MQPEPQPQSIYHQLQNILDPVTKSLWQHQQSYIRTLLIEKDDFAWTPQTLDLVAGVDLSASKLNPNIVCASLVIYSLSKKTMLYQQSQIVQINQPYIPGFLAFRQIPPLLALFNKLKAHKPDYWPQLLLVDGNGILHQNQCGLACHLGCLLDLPTIGIGKTLFYIDGLDKDTVKMQCQTNIKKQGDFTMLVGHSGKTWGAGLRNTHLAKNPIFVSVGHKITLNTAISCVMKLSLYRVVEPIRLADKLSRQLIDQADISDPEKFANYQMVFSSTHITNN